MGKPLPLPDTETEVKTMSKADWNHGMTGEGADSVRCACPLTVQHTMIDCVELAYIRSRFLDVRNMKDLFDSVTPSTILLYVRAIRLFFKM